MIPAPIFGYVDQKAALLKFAEQVPALLLRHPLTAHLSLRVAELDFAEALQSRFTVAVVGQMRVGKSTLLNALIGRSLAPVGVTETTATVNWFRYGEGAICNQFRAHWTDGSTEDVPLARVGEWLGQADNAWRTRALDFFAPSDFLRACNLVDTPGTRSTIAGHEEAVQSFLAEVLETESLRHGGRADAVVYAINPVARRDDSNLLRLFGERTRLPGASAYNSIAVVQKWEHLRPDPMQEAQRMCERLRGQLAGKVAAVLPVSGLVGLSCIELPATVWDQIAHLAAGTPQGVLDELMLAPDYFRDDVSDAVISKEGRTELLSQVSWPVLAFAVWMARARGIASGEALHEALWDAAGIDRLRTLLQERFLALAGLIRAGAVLSKARAPCATALLMLREVREGQSALEERARASHEILARAVAKDKEFGPVLAYVEGSLQSVQAEARLAKEVEEELDGIVHRAEREFRLLERDVECLRWLDALWHEAALEELAPEELMELRRLFGQAGPEIGERLGLAASHTGADALEAALGALERWSRRQWRVRGELQSVLEHAVERLLPIINWLDEKP
ncbi:dynamin family protein [Belnapia sp. T6]|uniref:Dynamin family protein n=1 Tax=Belnapia mucosa TaxID=2804532 RepID=A0ABS1VE12_9PROT|nr:dynamin family protein [Belnapia mucosa]MBL6459381.1 dynamin family protein [Belnapia mucosa]